MQLTRLRHNYKLSALADMIISSTIKLKIEETGKETHSLTRKLVGYRTKVV